MSHYYPLSISIRGWRVRSDLLSEPRPLKMSAHATDYFAANIGFYWSEFLTATITQAGMTFHSKSSLQEACRDVDDHSADHKLWKNIEVACMTPPTFGVTAHCYFESTGE